MARGQTILISAKLAAHQLERHLEPLARSENVERILVVRHEPVSERLSKVENVTFSDSGTARNLGRMHRTIQQTMRAERVDWVIGFNPVPWGSIGAVAAMRRGVPTVLSLIGSDFRQLNRPAARPLWLVLKRADHITVTGARMRDGLLAEGVPESRVHVLPHVVDTERFAPGADPPTFDIVSVGQLIHRKRMDLLIEAVRILRVRGLRATLGILGQGPLEGELRTLIQRSGLTDQVTLLGYREDVESVLQQGRIYALASEWEGVPFALIEAMSAGLVPVVTDVGTIDDWVTNGENGRLVPPGDPTALANALEHLLRNEDSYRRQRTRALEIRQQLSLDVGIAFWDRLLAD